MEARLYLEGEVGPREYGYPVNYATVRDFFIENADAESFVIEMNGPGGDVYEGLAIKNLMEAQVKHVKTVAINVASIMTVMFLAGKEREAYPGSMFMVHNPSSATSGDAEKMEKTAKLLRAIEEDLLNYYESRTKASREVLAKLMAEETYLTETQLLEMGFVDRIGTGAVSAQAKREFSPVAMIVSGTKDYTENQKQMENNILMRLSNLLDEKLGPKALEIALANGLTAKVRTNEPRAKAGDGIALLKDGKAGEIEDGEYATADGDLIFVVASGKIQDVLKKVDTEAAEILNMATVEQLVGAIAETFAAKLDEMTSKFSAQFDALKAEIDNKLTTAETISAKVEGALVEMKAQLQEAEQEIIDTKRGISSSYAPLNFLKPESRDKDEKTKTADMTGVTFLNTADVRKIQNKNRANKESLPAIGVAEQ